MIVKKVTDFWAFFESIHMKNCTNRYTISYESEADHTVWQFVASCGEKGDMLKSEQNKRRKGGLADGPSTAIMTYTKIQTDEKGEEADDRDI